ncbi:MAG: hypothetical protein WDN06_12425 [Asticcacaulis sp.]
MTGRMAFSFYRRPWRQLALRAALIAVTAPFAGVKYLLKPNRSFMYNVHFLQHFSSKMAKTTINYHIKDNFI